jgi:hypothetical protein
MLEKMPSSEKSLQGVKDIGEKAASKLEIRFNPFLQKFGQVLSVQQEPSDKDNNVFTLMFREGQIIKIGLDQNGELEFAQTGRESTQPDGSIHRGAGLQQVHNLEDIVSAGYLEILKNQIKRGVVWGISKN